MLRVATSQAVHPLYFGNAKYILPDHSRLTIYTNMITRLTKKSGCTAWDQLQLCRHTDQVHN